MLDETQKRTFIALACKVAWADGVVAPEERSAVRALVQKLGGTNMSEAELDGWLTSGAPEAEIGDLPEAVGQMFIYEAMQLANADGDVRNAELELVEALMARLEQRHEKASIAKVARVVTTKRR